MAEQTHNRDMTDQSDRQDLEDRVDELESTISKMLPGRRDALKLGGAALVGGAAMSGTASAGSKSKGTIGTSGALVDVESEDINNADTVTTENLVVNQSATLPFPAAPVLESGDSITVATVNRSDVDSSFVTMFDGTAKDVLGGVMFGAAALDFLYTFSDGTTLRKNGTGTTYSLDNFNKHDAADGEQAEIDILPPALDVTKIEVASALFNGIRLGAEVILKD
jgi:hypothetical protein